jgi:hypothetical protein
MIEEADSILITIISSQHKYRVGLLDGKGESAYSPFPDRGEPFDETG